jgi:dienelactone hydrolase
VTPGAVLEGDAVSIQVSGLKPGAAVTLHAQSSLPAADGARRGFHAQASFRADSRGRVDLAKDAPIAGDYSGADIRGLFWSQRPSDKDAEAQKIITALRLPAPAELEPDRVALRLEEAGVIEARASLQLKADADDVVRQEVRTPGLVGVFYARRGATKRPVVVLFGGSEGGLGFAQWLGPRLAARGYAVLGVGYFTSPDQPIEGLPTALNHIPVELLERGRDWLTARPEADVSRLAVMGGSKGGELTLLLAATYPWVKAAVAYVPADYVWQGFSLRGGGGEMGSSWSKGGKDLPFVPETGLREEVLKARQPGGEVRMANVHRANLAAASPATLEAARIQIEHSHAALMLIGGDDDQTGDSGASVRRAVESLRRALYPHRLESLVYPEAGHDIVGTGWRPTTTHNLGPFKDGGAPEADAHAQADAWTRMLAFLKQELGS